MKMDQVFCLNACGYLHDVIVHDEKFMAKIKVITLSDSNKLNQDDVWVDCEMAAAHREPLFELLAEVKKGNSVIVTFKAEYNTFVNVFSCQAPEDPNHIVTLRCKLLSLEDCYINGQLVGKNKFQLFAVSQQFYETKGVIL